MNYRKRFLILISTMALAMTVFAPAASAKAKEVELLTGKTSAITAGTSAWVALNWVAEEDVSNFKVVATDLPSGVTVSYPTNLSGYTGLAGGHYLDKDEVDYTALKIEIDNSVSKDAKFELVASYEYEGQEYSGGFKVKVPVAQFDGDIDLSMTTGEVTAAADGSWVSVSFAGHAPSSESFTMVVSDPAGLAVTYPGYGSVSSLHSDRTLSAGECDVARCFVNPAGETGSFPIVVEVQYDAGNGTQTIQGTVTVNVSA